MINHSRREQPSGYGPLDTLVPDTHTYFLPKFSISALTFEVFIYVPNVNLQVRRLRHITT